MLELKDRVFLVLEERKNLLGLMLESFMAERENVCVGCGVMLGEERRRKERSG